MRRRPEDMTMIPVQRSRRSRPDALDDVARLRGLVHDLGHGLATVSLLLEAARGEATDGFPDPLLDLAERETTRLLAVAHGGARRTDPDERTSVRLVLAQITGPADLTAPASVRLTGGPEIDVRIDAVLLGRIMSNLVDNAVRAAGTGGTVHVRAFQVGGEVVLEVADDGPGFRRGPSGTAQLGLGIVQRLLDDVGGRLMVEHVVPHGTLMRVTLPDRPAAARPDAAEGDPESVHCA